MSKEVGDKLEQCGFPIAALTKLSDENKSLCSAVYLVSKDANGRICVIAVPSGVFFCGIVVFLDKITVLVESAVALEWGILKGTDKRRKRMGLGVINPLDKQTILH